MSATRKTPRCGGYSLVEISLAVLVLAVGLVSILAVFPVALNWGGVAMASSTGSVAARTCFAELQEIYSDGDGFDLPDGTIWYSMNIPRENVGDYSSKLKDGGYHIRYQVVPSASLAAVTALVYRNDLDTLDTRQRETAEKNVLCRFEGKIFYNP
jgi:hypothetical protein